MDRPFVLADPGLSQEWGYTVLTRGRESNRLYFAASRARARDEFAPQDPEAPDPVVQLARSLSKSDAQTLAIDESPVLGALQELRRMNRSAPGRSAMRPKRPASGASRSAACPGDGRRLRVSSTQPEKSR